MEMVSEIVKICIPIIVGALIAIVPIMIVKCSESKQNRKEAQRQDKQEIYVELISLLGKVLKVQRDSEDLRVLQNRINLISITGSAEVVKALNDYIDTLSKAIGEEQNKKYCDLLKAIRVDLGVDKNINVDFPNIGLRDISIRVI